MSSSIEIQQKFDINWKLGTSKNRKKFKSFYNFLINHRLLQSLELKEIIKEIIYLII